MTLKDKLEIGLKEDAQYRKDNLPDSQVRGPEIPTGEGRSPEIPMARGDHNIVKEPTEEKEQKRRRALGPPIATERVAAGDSLGTQVGRLGHTNERGAAGRPCDRRTSRDTVSALASDSSRLGRHRVQPGVHLVLGPLACVAVALLDGAHELVVVSFGAHQIVVGQLRPPDFRRSFELLPLSRKGV